MDNFKDTHNWYVKVIVETGIIGLILALIHASTVARIVLSALYKQPRIPSTKAWALVSFLRSVACIIAQLALATLDLP